MQYFSGGSWGPTPGTVLGCTADTGSLGLRERDSDGHRQQRPGDSGTPVYVFSSELRSRTASTVGGQVTFSLPSGSYNFTPTSHPPPAAPAAILQRRRSRDRHLCRRRLRRQQHHHRAALRHRDRRGDRWQQPSRRRHARLRSRHELHRSQRRHHAAGRLPSCSRQTATTSAPTSHPPAGALPTAISAAAHRGQIRA
ncbi:MAG: hypothetical protein R2856_27055 [Caldilineaceae bacterium]